jgi:hypothetical protein
MGQESSVVKSMAIPPSGFIEAGTEYVIDGGTSTARWDLDGRCDPSVPEPEHGGNRCVTPSETELSLRRFWPLQAKQVGLA